MTDQQLRGLAAQAFNLAKKDLERKGFNFLLAAYHEGETLHRMRDLEAVLIQRLGREWLNSGRSKDIGFGIIRLGVFLAPPDAVMFGSVINKFEPTERLLALGPEKQRELADGGHDAHHEAVRDGLLTVCDALHITAQSEERVCLYMQNLAGGARPDVHFCQQQEFGGRMKMYGNDPAELLAKLPPEIRKMIPKRTA